MKNLAYIARADDFIHENEMAMVEQAVSGLDMTDKVKLVKTDSLYSSSYILIKTNNTYNSLGYNSEACIV